MKKSSKLLVAAGLAAGGALGALLAPDKGSETRKKLNKEVRRLARLMNGKCKEEKLKIAKEKLEEHKERVEMHIQRINEKIAEYEAGELGEKT